MPVDALRGVSWTMLAYAATRVITLLTTLVLARLLAPADFGLFAMATLAMELLSVFSGLWLGAALILRRDMDARAQGTVLTLLVVAGAALALLLVALAPALAAFFGEPRIAGIVALLAAVLLISGVGWFYETVLQRELAFRRRFACQVARAAAFSLVALSLAAFGAGVWSLIAGYVAGHVANIAALLALTPYRVRPAFDRREARRIVASGRGFLWQDLSGFLSENADYLAVGRMLGPSQLGFYAMAFRQASLPHYAIAEPVGKVTFPAFARMRAGGEDVRPAFLVALRMVALATCPAGVILSAAAVPFTLALLGEDWRPMAAPLAVLGVWAVMRPLQVTVGNLLNSLGRAEVYGRVSMLSLGPLVAATFAAAAAGGITAVAWVLLAHMTVTFGVLVVAAARAAGLPVRALAAALWPFAPASGAAWLVVHAIADATAPPGIALAAAAAGCLVTYVAVLGLIDPGLLRETLAAVRRAAGRVSRGPRLRRRSRMPAVALACAAVAGALAAVEPKLALAALGGGFLLALPFLFPVTHLVALLLCTAIVPYDVQNAVAFGGGAGSPGIFPSDLLLVGGLARAGLLLLDARLERPPRWVLTLAVAVLGVAGLQALNGVRSGWDAGTAGTELRVLLGFGAAVIALPLLRDPATRRRLHAGLLGVGLAVGLWGIAQWTVDIPFTAAEDAGVREGVRFTTAGRGQIQGGLFAFPVMVVMGMAALLSHEPWSRRTRALIVAVVALNAVDLLLTYERTFWVATVLALGLVVMRATPRQRVRALAVGPALLALVLAGTGVLAPSALTAARERLLSLGQYGSDLSVRFRLTETRSVIGAIEAHPVVGSGLGATILWGRPYEGVRPTTESFAHNGYLWLVWKLGAPAAALVLALIGAAMLSRGPPVTTTPGALRAGAQAALLLLLIASLTFPAFNTLGITAVMGVLVALCAQSGREAGLP
jgi:O-antigen/teichoic acid export membrane protein